ncbi:MAG: hypothetical protein JNJ88_00625 [Planctomycetes bacterium]|nr:hypothetical protein [Planctomycetota bacterium]
MRARGQRTATPRFSIPAQFDAAATGLAGPVGVHFCFARQRILHAPHLAPVVEFHGLTYLTDGEQLPFNAGGLDDTTLRSMHMAGETVVWTGVGARFDLTPGISLSSTFEFPLSKADDDIMGHRIAVDLTLRW